TVRSCSSNVCAPGCGGPRACGAASRRTKTGKKAGDGLHGGGSRQVAVLLIDLYELTMAQAYFEERLNDSAAFSLFVRRLPSRRNYLLACGLDDVLAFLESLHFDAEALDFLRSLNFSAPFLEYLGQLRFTGDVYALAEGTPVFPNEPILEVVAPLVE